MAEPLRIQDYATGRPEDFLASLGDIFQEAIGAGFDEMVEIITKNLASARKNSEGINAGYGRLANDAESMAGGPPNLDELIDQLYETEKEAFGSVKRHLEWLTRGRRDAYGAREPKWKVARLRLLQQYEDLLNDYVEGVRTARVRLIVLRARLDAGADAVEIVDDESLDELLPE